MNDKFLLDAKIEPLTPKHIGKCLDREREREKQGRQKSKRYICMHFFKSGVNFQKSEFLAKKNSGNRNSITPLAHANRQKHGQADRQCMCMCGSACVCVLTQTSAKLDFFGPRLIHI